MTPNELFDAGSPLWCKGKTIHHIVGIYIEQDAIEARKNNITKHVAR